MTWKEKVFNLPNRLTFLRIILTLVFLPFVFIPGLLPKIMAFLTFSLASFTDWYDGYAARKFKLETDFGKLIDPIADKILIFSCFLAFLQMNLVKAWMVIVILSREIIITALRLYALNRGKVIGASLMGKHKLVSQVVAIYCILLSLILKEALSLQGIEFPQVEKITNFLIYLSMLTTVVLTTISGISYIWKNRDLLET